MATISFCVRRLPDSSTLKTSFADGGKCSIFVLVDSFLVSAKSIPHLQFTCSLPTTPSIIKPIIAAIMACMCRCYVENMVHRHPVWITAAIVLSQYLSHLCGLLDIMPTIKPEVTESNHRDAEFKETRRLFLSPFGQLKSPANCFLNWCRIEAAYSTTRAPRHEEQTTIKPNFHDIRRGLKEIFVPSCLNGEAPARYINIRIYMSSVRSVHGFIP